MPSFTSSQHHVKLPEDLKEKALRWVQTQTATTWRRPDGAPFRRLLDFWFACIAWAVHQGMDPVPTASGAKFVNLGPKPQDVRHFEPWRGDLLTFLAIRDFGHDDPQIHDTRTIMDLANRYAEAGAPALVRRLEEVEELEVTVLYTVADLFSDEIREVVGARADEYF